MEDSVIKTDDNTIIISKDKVDLAINCICDMAKDNDINGLELVCAMNSVKAGVAMQLKANAETDGSVNKSLQEVKELLDVLLEPSVD